MIVQQDIAFGLDGIKNGLDIRYIDCDVIDCTGDAGTLRALVDLKKQTFETQEDKAFAVIKGHRKCFGEPESLIPLFAERRVSLLMR